MQYNQPFCCTGFQNNSQFPSYQIQPYYPEVIGEGDVLSMTSPDGSVYCYFIPVTRRNRRIFYPMSSNAPNFMPVWTSDNNEAWVVRNIFNTYPTAGPNQQMPNYSGDPFARQYVNFDNSPAPCYVQKFHNDTATSTTDLHYFYPRLRHNWLAKDCTGVQVQLNQEEKSIYHYGTICNRPHYCAHKADFRRTDTHCDGNDRIDTPMAVDEIKTENVCRCDEAQSKAKEKKSSKVLLTNRNKIRSCACHSRSNVGMSDKAVTTYTDQAIDCNDLKRRDRSYQRKTRSKKNNAKCNCPYSIISPCDSSCCCTDSDELDKKNK